MSTPTISTIRWFRIAAALLGAAAVCYVVWLKLQVVPLEYPGYALAGPLAVYLTYVACRGWRGWSGPDLTHILGGVCLVASGSMVGHSLYLWFRCIEVIGSSAGCGTTLLRLSMMGAQTGVCLAYALAGTLVTFAVGRRHFTGGWRWAYVIVVGWCVALFAVGGYLGIRS